jgi:hypothetical protein
MADRRAVLVTYTRCVVSYLTRCLLFANRATTRCRICPWGVGYWLSMTLSERNGGAIRHMVLEGGRQHYLKSSKKVGITTPYHPQVVCSPIFQLVPPTIAKTSTCPSTTLPLTYIHFHLVSLIACTSTAKVDTVVRHPQNPS